MSIHRDREPSSSRVPLRRGYTYPPSAARRSDERDGEIEEREREEKKKKQQGKKTRPDSPLAYFAPGRVSSTAGAYYYSCEVSRGTHSRSKDARVEKRQHFNLAQAQFHVRRKQQHERVLFFNQFFASARILITTEERRLLCLKRFGVQTGSR